MPATARPPMTKKAASPASPTLTIAVPGAAAVTIAPTRKSARRESVEAGELRHEPEEPLEVHGRRPAARPPRAAAPWRRAQELGGRRHSAAGCPEAGHELGQDAGPDQDERGGRPRARGSARRRPARRRAMPIRKTTSRDTKNAEKTRPRISRGVFFWRMRRRAIETAS